jgi:diphthamide biosynthesis protein 2
MEVRYNLEVACAEFSGGIDRSNVFNKDSDTNAMILRNQQDTVSKPSESAAGTVIKSKRSTFNSNKFTSTSIGQFLQERSYQGLEIRVGQDAPSLLEQGRSGIARGYEDDHR